MNDLEETNDDTPITPDDWDNEENELNKGKKVNTSDDEDSEEEPSEEEKETSDEEDDEGDKEPSPSKKDKVAMVAAQASKPGRVVNASAARAALISVDWDTELAIRKFEKRQKKNETGEDKDEEIDEDEETDEGEEADEGEKDDEDSDEEEEDSDEEEEDSDEEDDEEELQQLMIKPNNIPCKGFHKEVVRRTDNTSRVDIYIFTPTHLTEKHSSLKKKIKK